MSSFHPRALGREIMATFIHRVRKGFTFALVLLAGGFAAAPARGAAYTILA